MPSTTHVTLSPSSAHRWMACPGAPRMEAQMPPEGTSIHAIEGTAAHELAEMCLREGGNPADHVGLFIPVEGDGVEVTQEMADAVQVYVDHVRSVVTPGAVVKYEMSVTLDKINPPAKMAGTSDAVVWLPLGRTLHVIDYKHGRGVVVEVEGNKQTRYYALGAVLTLGVKPEQIVVTIVQPRADHPDGPIRSEVLSWEDLVEFKDELMAAAEAASAPDAPVGPVGDHCRWCRAKAICPAQRSNALVVAQQEFDDELPVSGLPAPAGLSMDQMTEVLEKAPYVEEWFNAVREHARQALERGEEVPGWKLVAKRAYRRWTNEDEAEKWLREQRVKVSDFMPRKMVSPAQAEKIVGKGQIPEELIEAKSSGYNLAHEDNPRPAITPGSEAADEFDVQ